MAEDPGVRTLSAGIEAMRQLPNFVQDAAKSIVNTGADIADTYLFMSWRKNSMGASHQHGRAVQAASRTVVERHPLDSIKKETRKRAALKNRGGARTRTARGERMQERKARSLMHAYRIER